MGDEKCLYCGGPAGINTVDRPDGKLHYSRIACSEFLKAERDGLLLRVREMTEDRDAWIKKETATSNRLVEALLKEEELNRLISGIHEVLQARLAGKCDALGAVAMISSLMPNDLKRVVLAPNDKAGGDLARCGKCGKLYVEHADDDCHG